MKYRLLLLFVIISSFIPSLVWAQAPIIQDSVIVAHTGEGGYCAYMSDSWVPVSRLAPVGPWRTKKNFLLYARGLKKKMKRKKKLRRRLAKVIKRRARILRRSSPFCAALLAPAPAEPDPPVEETPIPTPTPVPDTPPESLTLDISTIEELDTMVPIAYTDADGDLATECEVEIPEEVMLSAECTCDNGACTFSLVGTTDFIGEAQVRLRIQAGGAWSPFAGGTLTFQPSAEDPGRLSSLALWLDPAAGLLNTTGEIPANNEHLGSWTGTNGAGGTLTLTSGSTRDRDTDFPRFLATGSPTGGPAVRFSGWWGGGGFLESTESLPIGRSHIYSVYDGTNGANTWATLLDSLSSPKFTVALWNLNSIGLGWPPPAFDNYDVQNLNLVWTSNGNTRNRYSAGTSLVEISDPARLTPENLMSNSFRVGSRMAGPAGSWHSFPQCLNGVLSELLIFSDELDDRNHEWVLEYLRTRHNLSE